VKGRTMNEGTFEKELRKAQQLEPFLFEMESDPPASEELIQSVEKNLNVQFPLEFREFLKKYGSGEFAYTHLYSLSNDIENNIIEENKILNDKRVVAISDNGAGDYYCYLVKENYCESSIVILDHETGDFDEYYYKNIFEFLYLVGLDNE